MTKINDIRILVCNQEPDYLAFVSKTLSKMGFEKIFIAGSQDQVRQVCDTHRIDIALIDTDFNGTGGFVTGEALLSRFPNVFLLYITDPKRIMDPIKSIFSGAVGFVIKHDQDELISKVTTWSHVAKNTLKAREFVDGR